MTKLMITIVACCVALAGSAWAGALTIYSQDFSGSYSALSNSVVTYAAAGYDTTWSAGSTLGADGSFTNSSSTQGAAILSFTPVSNKTYRFEASFRGMGSSGYSFYQAGFVSTDRPDDGGTLTGDNPRGHVFFNVHRSGTVTAFGFKNVTSERIDGGVSTDIGSATDVDLRIDLMRIDTSTYDVTMYAKKAGDSDYTLIGSDDSYTYNDVEISWIGFSIRPRSGALTTSGRITAFHLYEPVTFGTVVTIK